MGGPSAPHTASLYNWARGCFILSDNVGSSRFSGQKELIGGEVHSLERQNFTTSVALGVWFPDRGHRPPPGNCSAMQIPGQTLTQKPWEREPGCLGLLSLQVPLMPRAGEPVP